MRNTKSIKMSSMMNKLSTLAFSGVMLTTAGCAVTSQSYHTPSIKGSEPSVVVSGSRGFTGSGCLATIVIDGTVAGTVGAYETLAVPVQPGPHFVRWDIKGGGLCGAREDLAHRMVTVTNSPVLLKLDIGGLGKSLIPIVGLFSQPEYRILREDEE